MLGWAIKNPELAATRVLGLALNIFLLNPRKKRLKKSTSGGCEDTRIGRKLSESEDSKLFFKNHLRVFLKKITFCHQ